MAACPSYAPGALPANGYTLLGRPLESSRSQSGQVFHHQPTLNRVGVSCKGERRPIGKVSKNVRFLHAATVSMPAYPTRFETMMAVTYGYARVSKTDDAKTSKPGATCSETMASPRGPVFRGSGQRPNHEANRPTGADGPDPDRRYHRRRSHVGTSSLKLTGRVWREASALCRFVTRICHCQRRSHGRRSCLNAGCNLYQSLPDISRDLINLLGDLGYLTKFLLQGGNQGQQ